MDTRALVRHLRSAGAMRGMVATDGTPPEQLVAEARALPAMTGLELASRVTCETPRHWTKGSIELTASPWQEGMAETAPHAEVERFRVVAYDFGIKQNILRLLVDMNCDVTVVPAKTPPEAVLAMKPEGIFLSNGPGDPEPVTYGVEAIRKLLGRGADLWDLPGAPALRPRAGRQDLQAEIRASRLEPSGEESADRPR